jgi:hypothetical protein
VKTELKRVFVVVWMVLGLAGAMNHTIAQSLFGRTFDLVLPHLKYGHVMFNKNLTTVRVHEFEGADHVRHPIADLVQTPALGYRNARVEIDLMTKPDYLLELCFRATRARHEPLVFHVAEYDVTVDPRTPQHTADLPCDEHGLTGL